MPRVGRAVEQGDGRGARNWLKRPVPLLLCQLDWCQRSQAGVGTHVIVVEAPTRDELPRFGQIQESMLIQAFVPESAVEAFNVSVLHRLARARYNARSPGLEPTGERPH
jgi:hypothetical protein